MAQKQKRPSPHDVPPSVSSDDEPIPSSQPDSEKEDEEVEEDRDQQSSSEEDEDDDEEEEEEKTQPQSKNPKSAASSESATDSDSGSETESESRGVSDYQIQPKPLASKPVDETPIKANSKSSKRPVESNGSSGDASRAKKKKVTDAAAVGASSESSDDDDGGDGRVEASEVKKSSGTGSDSKSIPFQRLFSEEDEIAILNGMIEFKKTTGNDPFRFINFFHRFVSKSLHIDASSNQLKDKIQRLKRKFKANAKGKSFSKRHDEEAFELSKKIWGNAGGADEVVEKAKSNGKALKSAMKEGSRGNEVPLKSKPEPKQEVKLLLDSKDSKEEAVNIETDIPFSIVQGFGSYGLNENMMKKGLDLMGASDRAKLEKQWKELEAAEFEAYVKRAELVAKHARLIWEAYEASNH
ncbi:unnamed protein product [Lupinus luteus]|uniref:Uncharacterized protein n=1 Tax=Lupinus luteus TaxID=3873 RepID=A0AAV1WJJ5_LUPLU